MREKIFKNKNGITLIALIITIIVMLILVAVTITVAVNGGLFGYARNASVKTNEAMDYEQMLADGKVHIDDVWYASIDDYINNGEGFSDYYTETTTYKATGDTYTAVIPAGFARGVTEGINTVDGGLVIQDKDGNQFVWIPVNFEESGEDENDNGLDDAFESVFKRSNWDANARSETALNSNYKEPYASAAQWETDEYNAMMLSVQNNKGFYIGRYEVGTKEPRIVDKTIVEAFEPGEGLGTSKAVIQRDCYPYNYVAWGPGMTEYEEEINGYYNYYYYNEETDEEIDEDYDDWNAGHGAVYLSRQMYANSSSVTSTLCYGVQWDAMLDFIKNEKDLKNSTSWGNYYNNRWTINRTTAKYYDFDDSKWKPAPISKNNTDGSILLTTGANDNFKAKNIYDVAGNLYEWTMEAYSDSDRVFRGGYYNYYGSINPASYRYYYPPTDTSNRIGFRVALYL